VRSVDLVVIGGGVTGFTAGLFGARYGLDTLVLERAIPGGQIVNVDRIENYPGFPKGVSGAELAAFTQMQAMGSGCTMEMLQVTRLAPQDPYLLLETSGESIRTRAVIVAAGSAPRHLGVPHEEDYAGRGMSHCATCDGPLFMGEVVGVVGGGDSATDEALTLTRYASRVILFHRRGELRAQCALQKRVLADPKIEVRWHSQVTEVLPKQRGLRAVQVHDIHTGDISEVELAGLFVYVGLDPSSAFLQGVVDLDKAGHIATDVCMQSSMPGVYAAGDIRQHSVAQVVSGAGDGATAAIYAAEYIRSRTWH
jgi:thioredoxin reductase (NADPH)